VSAKCHSNVYANSLATCNQELVSVWFSNAFVQVVQRQQTARKQRVDSPAPARLAFPGTRSPGHAAASLALQHSGWCLMRSSSF
jgi:hypothetical protein